MFMVPLWWAPSGFRIGPDYKEDQLCDQRVVLGAIQLLGSEGSLEIELNHVADDFINHNCMMKPQ